MTEHNASYDELLPVASSPKPTIKKKLPVNNHSPKAATGATRKTPSTAALPENRKLTKQGQSSLRDQWSASRGGASRDALMAALVDVAQEKFGTEHVFGTRTQLEQLAIGIPMPSIALEYLLANNIFPLASLVMLAGTWGTCKSSFLYEIFRWFHELNGVAIHIDTEQKFDAQFACDIMRVPGDALPVVSNRANSTEQMQELLSHYIKEIKLSLQGTKEKPGPGRTVPVCFGVDSLAGATSEEVHEKILKEGSASRAHPIAALKNSHYLPAFKKEMAGYPFTLVVTNHLKTKTDDRGNSQDYTIGGQVFNFHESFELQNTVWRQRIANAQFEGIGIRLKCSKNSFGPTGRSIRTRFLWWPTTDAVTGAVRTTYLWDWNWSLCTLLNEAEGALKSRLLAQDLKINCRSPAADVECLANFPAIGMSKDEYAPFQEVGQRIQENEEVCDRLREALQINIRYYLDRPYDEITADHLNKLN